MNVLNVLKYGYYFKMLYQIGNSISELQANYRVYLCVVLVYVLSNNCLFFLGGGGGGVIIVFMNKLNFLYCLPGVILSKEIRENLT